MPNASWVRLLIQLAATIVGTAAIIAVSSITATHPVTRQLAQLIRREAAPVAAPASDISEANAEIDFYSATGTSAVELRKFLEQAAAHDHLGMYPAHLSFWSDDGECLIDHPVEVVWRSGRDRVNPGDSGVLRIMLRPELLDGLKFVVPQRFRIIKQSTIPLGTAYRPYSSRTAPESGRSVVNDFEIETEIWRQLARWRAMGGEPSTADFAKQIRRSTCDWKIPELDRVEAGDLSANVRRRRESVVIISHLLADGTIVHATGVVLDRSGLVATAYHVVDKPQAVARCVTTITGRTFSIQEILAANRPGEVALVRIEADGLSAAPGRSADANAVFTKEAFVFRAS